MKNPFSLNMITLEGTARQRGLIHGETIRARIQENVEFAKAAVNRAGDAGDDYFSQLANTSPLLGRARQWTPHLVDEMQGIADGSNLPFENIFMLNSIEYLASGDQPLQCSTAGAWGQPGLPTLLAQTADNAVFWKDHLTLLHILFPGSDLEVYTMTFSGLIGVYGLNNRGIGVAVNSLSELNGSEDGIGIPLAARSILERTSLAEVDAFVSGVKFISGENIVVGSSEKIVDYEVSGSRICEYCPEAGSTRLFHTNHAMVNDDRRDLEALAQQMSRSVSGLFVNTHTRLQTLKDCLGDPVREMTVDAIKMAFSTHGEYPICGHEETGHGSRTNYGIIMELGQNPVLNLCTGSPCDSSFWRFRF